MTVEQASIREELFGPSQRAVTVGIVLLISLVAFENMGVGTAMPALVADLGTVSSYAWPFVAFIATNVVGTVLGGRWCDRRGPKALLLAAPAVFGARPAGGGHGRDDDPAAAGPRPPGVSAPAPRASPSTC